MNGGHNPPAPGAEYAEVVQKLAAQMQSNPVEAARLLQQQGALGVPFAAAASAGAAAGTTDSKPAAGGDLAAQLGSAGLMPGGVPQTSEAVSNFVSWLASNLPAAVQGGGQAPGAPGVLTQPSPFQATTVSMPLPHLGAAGAGRPAPAAAGTLGPGDASGFGSMREADRSGSGGGSDRGAPATSEDVAGLVHKVQKRLAQNRESARKCRQRKKAYLTQLEEEVLQLRQQHQDAVRQLQQSRMRAEAEGRAAAVAAAVGSAAAAGSSALPDCIGRLLTWRAEYADALATLQRAVSAVEAGADVAEMSAAVANCLQLLGKERTLKADAGSKALLLLLSGEHMPPAERLLLWMGGTRPSEMLRYVSRDLKARSMLENEQEGRFARMMESWSAQEDAVTDGYSALRTRVLFGFADDAAAAGGGGDAAAAMDGRVSARVLGQLDALRMLLLHADELRAGYYTDLEKVLSTRQYAAALLIPSDMCNKVQRLGESYADLSARAATASGAAPVPMDIGASQPVQQQQQHQELQMAVAAAAAADPTGPAQLQQQQLAAAAGAAQQQQQLAAAVGAAGPEAVVAAGQAEMMQQQEDAMGMRVIPHAN